MGKMQSNGIGKIMLILAVVILVIGLASSIFRAVVVFGRASDYSKDTKETVERLKERIEELEDKDKLSESEEESLKNLKERLSDISWNKTSLTFGGIVYLLRFFIFAAVSIGLIALSKLLEKRQANAMGGAAVPAYAQPARPAGPSYAMPRTPTPPAPQANPASFCRNCGKSFTGTFCPYCGTPKG